MKNMEIADKEDLIFERWLRQRNSGELVWKTKTGGLIPIKDMTDGHLANTITLLERTEEMRDAYYDWSGAHEDAGDRI